MLWIGIQRRDVPAEMGHSRKTSWRRLVEWHAPRNAANSDQPDETVLLRAGPAAAKMRCGQWRMIFSLASGAASRKVCVTVLP